MLFLLLALLDSGVFPVLADGEKGADHLPLSLSPTSLRLPLGQRRFLLLLSAGPVGLGLRGLKLALFFCLIEVRVRLEVPFIIVLKG